MTIMSKRWFTCLQWTELVSAHNANDAEAGRAFLCRPT
jgi:hypothetical protein